jgi:hypothetical protein
MYLDDFMCKNESINYTKLEETEYRFNEFVLIFQRYSCHKGLRT